MLSGEAEKETARPTANHNPAEIRLAVGTDSIIPRHNYI